MEKERICKIRTLHRAISSLDLEFQEAFGLNLNEAMLLCSLSGTKGLSAGELSEQLGLTKSNTSKVLSSVEKRHLVVRSLHDEDKRNMFFSLTAEGRKRLGTIKCENLHVPSLLSEVLKWE